MFDFLGNSFSELFQKLQSNTVITEEDFNLVTRRIRVILLEADVSLKAVKIFIERLKEAVIGKNVIKGVSASKMILKIVHEQVQDLLGSENAELNLSAKAPVVFLVFGLQGAGKTTTCVKLAHMLQRKMKKNVLLASADIYRPAAQQQLKILADGVGINTLEIVPGQVPIDILNRAIKEANMGMFDVLIVDTAGRLHIDDDMMKELSELSKAAKPTESLIVLDSMTGQVAADVAATFNDAVGITGAVLTRIDGDARGGAAMSMRVVAGVPIKFLANGEKVGDLEVFHPDRIANRILEIGDIVSFVEKAKDAVGQEKIDKFTDKVKKGQFDLNDMAEQLEVLSRMGGVLGLMKLLPNLGGFKDKFGGANFDDKKLKKYRVILSSMTKLEKFKPKVLNSSRKQRIAKGAGVGVEDINELIRQYHQMSNLVSKFGKMSNKGANIRQEDIMKVLKDQSF